MPDFRIPPISASILILLALGSGPAPAQGDSGDVDYDLFLGTMIDDPDRAGSAPYHLWQVFNDSSIPVQFSAAVGTVWSDLSQLDADPSPLSICGWAERTDSNSEVEWTGRSRPAMSPGSRWA